MDKFVTGETIDFRIEIRNKEGVLVNPTTSITISIWDSANSLKINVFAMTQDDGLTGKYHYYYTTPATGPTGEWRVTYTATSGSYVTKKRDRFAVIVEEVMD